MASNERSLGWTTSTINDGTTAYDSGRMVAMENKTLGNGTLVIGSLLALSGVGTSTLTIADGAAIINGFFYESTSASTIPTGTLNTTYTLALICNNTGVSPGSTWTVARSTADTTTVLPNTARMALATNAQLGLIGAGNYIAYASVSVNGSGQVTSITPYYPFAQTRQLPNTQYVWLGGGTAAIAANGIYYDVTGYGSASNVLTSTDGTITANATTGAITVRQSGLYTFSYYLSFNATSNNGFRNANIKNLAVTWGSRSAASLGLSDCIYHASTTIPISVTLGGSNVYTLQAMSTSVISPVIDSYLTISRE